MPELITCPNCERELRVPDDLIGKAVKCPSCNATFTAQIPGRAAPDPTERLPAVPEPPPQFRREEAPREEPFEDDEEDYEEEAPVRRRRRRRYIRRDVEPHRGNTILVLGILSIVLCPFLGPFAWVMGNTDMKKIRAGEMDREGEGSTQAGRIIGIISSILLMVQLGFILLYILAIIVALVAGIK